MTTTLPPLANPTKKPRRPGVPTGRVEVFTGSSILLASITAVVLNAFFNGARGSVAEARDAAMQADH